MTHSPPAFRRLAVPLFVALCSVSSRTTAQTTPPHRTENVIFVMTDGLRWQEVFGGADKALMTFENGAPKNPARFEKEYLQDTPEARRKALMPFVWGEMAEHGQVFGNKLRGSSARVTNGLKFSYPGYQETLCGFADSAIDSNEAGPNPNRTVFEWLHAKERFHGRVAAFGAWDAFDRIFNKQRCGFCVNSGFAPLKEGVGGPAIDLLNRLKAEVPSEWSSEPFDAVAFHTSLEYFKLNKPRLLYVSLGETDEWAHAGKYPRYLMAAKRADSYVRELWDAAQAMPGFRDHTAMIFCPDHGRGSVDKGKQSWRNHGKDIDGADDTWIAFLGPDTPALGERQDIAPVTQNQIAATIAALLGEDYCADVPKAGPAIREVLGR